MFRSYLKVAYRNMLRRKMFSAIHIVGLALGMTAALFLLSYASFELSYDKFHEHRNEIYMIRLDSYKDNVPDGSTMASFHAEAPAIRDQYPDVENFVRLHTASGMLRRTTLNGEVLSYFERDGYYADSSFFSVFSFPLIRGDRNSVLKSPNSMVISETASRKYFGGEDPMGKTMELAGWEGGEYVVEGVFKDVPSNSHVQFDFLFSIEKLLNNNQFKRHGWFWENFQTYLLIKPGTDIRKLHAGMDHVVESNIGADLRKANSAKKLILVPLLDIHLYSSIAYAGNGNYQIVYFILVMACLLLCIAWLNYLILSTAAAVKRAKEIGIRKVMGSERSHLIKQFIVEALFVGVIAIVITALLIAILHPYFSALVGGQRTFDFVAQRNFWVVVIGGIAFGIFLSGFYPGVVLSSFQSIIVLKDGPVKTNSGQRAWKFMVVFQFTGCILLIASTLTIREQLLYMRSQPIGIDIKQKMILRTPAIVPGESRLASINAFKNLLMQHHAVKAVTSSSEVPGKSIFWTKEFKLVRQSDNEKEGMHVMSVDEDFLTTYGLSLVAGRNFSSEFPADFGGSAILNETAVRRLGMKNAESAIDEHIVDVLTQRIIGVVKDYQQQSLKYANVPIIFQYIPWSNDYFTVSLESENIPAEIDIVTELYKKAFPGNAVEYYFLDDFMNQRFKSDQQFWRVFQLFSALAIFISCLGLFGLSSFMISGRTREIGIRKVLGSSIVAVVRLLSVDFLILIVAAFVVAVPLIALVMDQWLDSFANRIDIPLWIYMASGAIAFVVAMTTVVGQAIKAAGAAPIDAIKSE